VNVACCQSCDIHESGRLATCGGDNFVRIWRLIESNGLPSVEFLSTLEKHSKTVNVVRFSPVGSVLASAGDDGVILLWHKTSDKGGVPFGAEDPTPRKELWSCFRQLNVLSPIHDLAWSPDGGMIVTGEFEIRITMCAQHDKKERVQGVTDPCRLLSRVVFIF